MVTCPASVALFAMMTLLPTLQSWATWAPTMNSPLLPTLVSEPPPAVPAQYVAVLQKDGNAPAFILTVDAASKSFTVRRVAATPEPGKSYELWIVSDKLQRPRSLGVIGGRDFTVNPALKSYDTDIVNQATYAVTIEPEAA